ncbi:Conserved_hypothetical protein [Hexamita inflata]|uniref:Uncharacterized protein n=1 Tax=Hexamita inflata TaxID=28002 RepID=A0AA86QJ00_9EUKA|nr:Conserved hypothetical protein [Hexamita inflata]
MNDQELLKLLIEDISQNKVKLQQQIAQQIIKRNELEGSQNQNGINDINEIITNLQNRIKSIDDLLNNENNSNNNSDSLFTYLQKQKLIRTRYTNPEHENAKKSLIQELFIDQMFGAKYQFDLKHVQKWRESYKLQPDKQITGNLIISSSSLSFLNDSVQNQQNRIQQFEDALESQESSQKETDKQIQMDLNDQEHKYMFFYMFVPENVEMRSVLVFGEFAKTYKVSKDQLATCKQISQDLKYHNITVNNIIHDLDVVYKQYMQYQVEVVYSNLQNDVSPYELCIDKQNIKQKYIENKLIEIDFEEVGDSVDCSQMIKHQRNRLTQGKPLSLSNKLDNTYIQIQDIQQICKHLQTNVFRVEKRSQSSYMGYQLFQKKTVNLLLQRAKNIDTYSKDKFTTVKTALFWIINYPLVMITTQCSGKSYQQMLIFTLYVVLKLYSDILLFNPIDLEEPEKKIYKTKSKTKDSCQPVEKEVKQFALHSSNKEGAQVLTAFSKNFLAQYISFLTKLLSQCTNNHLFRVNSYSLQDYNTYIVALKSYSTCNNTCETQKKKLEENMLFLHLAHLQNSQQLQEQMIPKVSLELNVENQLCNDEILKLQKLGEDVATILLDSNQSYTSNASYETTFAQVISFWDQIDQTVINDSFDKSVLEQFKIKLNNIKLGQKEKPNPFQFNILSQNALNELFALKYTYIEKNISAASQIQTISQMVTIQNIQYDYKIKFQESIYYQQIISYLLNNNYIVQDKVIIRTSNQQSVLNDVVTNLYYKEDLIQ